MQNIARIALARLRMLVILASSPWLVAAPMSAQGAHEPPADLSAADWSGIRAAHEAQRHAVRPVEGGFRASNLGQAWETLFDGRGFTTRPDQGAWTWGLELERYGFAGHERVPETPQQASAEGPRMTYDWDDTLQEWYVNDARGLEHGYIVRRRPPGAGDGPLTFTLAIRGDLEPAVSEDGRDVRFEDLGGNVVLTYSGLTVFDAAGRSVTARFESLPAGLRLSVEEENAVYPLTIDPLAQQAYLKASNTGSDEFGHSVAISDDTVVIGASREDSAATGVNGNEADETALDAGAAYVFVRSGTTWSQQAYLKASNTEAGDRFGHAVAVSGDTIVVGAYAEASVATGVNGNEADNSAPFTGATYVFVRSGTTWSQQAYLKPSTTDVGGGETFGRAVAVSGDTIVVATAFERSSATGVNGNESDNSLLAAGAAWVFVRSGTVWSQEAYLKASNTAQDDQFGQAVAVSGDTIVVGANGEWSSATGVNGNQFDNSAPGSGAAYVFVRSGMVWSQEAYLKASNTGTGDGFGFAVGISSDTVVVGARFEDSSATGVDGNGSSNADLNAGAAYVFARSGTTWSQQAYLKASNTGTSDLFGFSVSVSGDSAVVGAWSESSNATGANGDESNNSASQAGAAYAFVRSGTSWSQDSYLKASNTGASDHFGESVAVSGGTIVVGAAGEDSASTGVGGDGTDNTTTNAGAAYVFVPSAGVPNQILAAELPGDPQLDDIGGDGTIGPSVSDPAQLFDLTLDCTGMSTGGVYAILLRSGHFSTPAGTSFGSFWITGVKLIKTAGMHTQNTVSWGGTILPNDPSLVGIPYTAQGFCSQSGNGSRLSTGLVQTIGP